MAAIYIASPYTNGDPVANVGRQVFEANRIIDAGHTPLAPLVLSHLLHLTKPRSYQAWIAFSERLLEKADAVIRLEGLSDGADREVLLAESFGLPVYASLDELLQSGDV